jgi:predicted nucleotidyltransferase
MKTSHPISCVIPSVDGLVLEVLAGTTAPMPLVSVHMLARNASVSGVRKALLRLVDTGVVHQVPGGFILNRDHLAADAVATLANMRSALFERIRALTAEWSPAPGLVGMFGSAARREGDDESDIDLLVVTESLDASGEAASLADAVERWTGNPCHVVALKPTDVRRMRRQREPVLATWQLDLVVLSGDPAILRKDR